MQRVIYRAVEMEMWEGSPRLTGEQLLDIMSIPWGDEFILMIAVRKAVDFS